jgi:hypothetical protein
VLPIPGLRSETGMLEVNVPKNGNLSLESKFGFHWKFVAKFIRKNYIVLKSIQTRVQKTLLNPHLNFLSMSSMVVGAIGIFPKICETLTE